MKLLHLPKETVYYVSVKSRRAIKTNLNENVFSSLNVAIIRTELLPAHSRCFKWKFLTSQRAMKILNYKRSLNFYWDMKICELCASQVMAHKRSLLGKIKIAGVYLRCEYLCKVLSWKIKFKWKNS